MFTVSILTKLQLQKYQLSAINQPQIFWHGSKTMPKFIIGLLYAKRGNHIAVVNFLDQVLIIKQKSVNSFKTWRKEVSRISRGHVMTRSCVDRLYLC